MPFSAVGSACGQRDFANSRRNVMTGLVLGIPLSKGQAQLALSLRPGYGSCHLEQNLRQTGGLVDHHVMPA